MVEEVKKSSFTVPNAFTLDGVVYDFEVKLLDSSNQVIPVNGCASKQIEKIQALTKAVMKQAMKVGSSKDLSTMKWSYEVGTKKGVVENMKDNSKVEAQKVMISDKELNEVNGRLGFDGFPLSSPSSSWFSSISPSNKKRKVSALDLMEKIHQIVTAKNIFCHVKVSTGEKKHAYSPLPITLSQDKKKSS